MGTVFTFQDGLWSHSTKVILGGYSSLQDPKFPPAKYILRLSPHDRTLLLIKQRSVKAFMLVSKR